MPWLRVPLVPMAFAFATGIAVAPWLPAHIAWPIFLGALAWGASLEVLGRHALAAGLLIVGIGAAGALRAAPLPPPPDHVVHLHLPVTARVEGRLAADPLRLAPDRVRARGLFDPRAVEALKHEHLRGARTHADRLWTLMMAELWMREYLDQHGLWTLG